MRVAAFGERTGPDKIRLLTAISRRVPPNRKTDALERSLSPNLQNLKELREFALQFWGLRSSEYCFFIATLFKLQTIVIESLIQNDRLWPDPVSCARVRRVGRFFSLTELNS